MDVWAVPMLLAGALFTGGVTWFAWMRLPVWRRMPLGEFESDFADAIRRADRVQPALLVATLVSAVGYSLDATEAARVLALAGIAGLVVTLVGSGAILVPLQRRLVRTRPPDDEVGSMRNRWMVGHLIRTLLALVSFALLAIATTS